MNSYYKFTYAYPSILKNMNTYKNFENNSMKTKFSSSINQSKFSRRIRHAVCHPDFEHCLKLNKTRKKIPPKTVAKMGFFSSNISASRYPYDCMKQELSRGCVLFRSVLVERLYTEVNTSRGYGQHVT